MSEASTLVFVIALAAFTATMVGGLFALRFRDRLHLILGFSAGAVIGVAFFDLLPEALSLASAYTPSFVLSVTALGFVLYLVLDRLVLLHGHDEEHTHTHRGAFGAGSLAVHSFLDGIGIGFAFHVSASVGVVVAVAVLAHDFSDGINTVSLIIKNAGRKAHALRWLILNALAPVAGVFSTFFFQIEQGRLGLLLALFAGFFFYIGASDLLPESHHNHPVRFTTVSTVLGVAFLYVVIHFLGA